MFFTKKNRLREVALFAGWLVLGFILLSLAGYSRNDPGWSLSVGSGGIVNNYGGYVGAFVADVLLSLFGRSAFLLVGVCLLAWHVLLRRLSGDGDGALSWPWITGGVFSKTRYGRDKAYCHATPKYARIRYFCGASSPSRRPCVQNN